MKRLFHFVLALTLLSFVNSYADTTWVEGRISGIWSTDGSPYILTGDSPEIFIVENDTLIIEPGVEVLFESNHGLLVEDATLIAEGTADDSILFRDIDEESYMSLILIYGYSNFRASFCEFRLRGGFNDLSYGSVRIEGGEINATFTYCTFVTYSIGLSSGSYSDVSVIDCYFTHSGHGGYGPRLRGNYSLVQQCVIYGSMDRVSHGEICNNWMGALRAYDETSVYNNILVSHRTALSGIDENVRYNCFKYNEQEFENVDIEGIGILDRVNANGDSTDRYYNLFQDPLQVGPIDSVWIYPDSYYLTPESPCIDAGDPEADPDPDGTRADIGAFFYPQQNVAVEPDSLEFTGIQTGLSDSVSVTIHNIGLDTLRVDSLFITQEGDVFSLSLDEDEFFLEPDSSHIVWVIFSPVVQTQYEAVLTIVSNDRDQGIIEITIIASALSVSDETTDIPKDFVLFNAYPNPFNNAVQIQYSLTDAAEIRIAVYDITGREIVTLVNGYKQAGYHTATLSANDLSSGLYFVQLKASDQVFTQKIMLIR